MQRVLNALEIHASERGDDVAVRDADGTSHSWRAVAEGVRRVQRWAQSVAAPGGFVAVSMPSGGAAWIAVLGVSRAGCVPVLLPASVAENTERMVRASSGQVAETYRMVDRGVLRAGAFADVIVFDPKTIRDDATYVEPTTLSTGMVWVFVNGQAAVQERKMMNVFAGRALRR